jgi:hypothetical protein
MMEFSADQEYSGHYLEVMNALSNAGWKSKENKREGRVISSLFTKNGYGIFVLFGGEEEIKDEYR